MSAGLAKDAWQRVFAFIKEDDLVRLYMTGDAHLMRTLRTASFLLRVKLHRRGGGPVFDLTKTHAMFPNINQLAIDRAYRSYNDGIPETKFASPYEPPADIQFKSVRSVSWSVVALWVHGDRSADAFFAMFPALERCRLTVDEHMDLNWLVRKMPPKIQVLQVIVNTPTIYHTPDLVLTISALPRSLTSLKIIRAHMKIAPNVERGHWPPSLTSLHLTAHLTLDLLHSLPPHLEKLHVVSSHVDGVSLPYSAFPPSLTYIWLKRQPIELDKPLSPALRTMECDIHCDSLDDFRRFMLPLPRCATDVQYDVLTRLVIASPNPIKFILEELPPRIDKIDLARFVLDVMDFPLPDVRDLLARRLNMPPVPVGVEGNKWVDRFHHIVKQSHTWETPISSIALGHADLRIFEQAGTSLHLDKQIVTLLLATNRVTKVSLRRTFVDEYGQDFAEDMVAAIASSPSITTLKMLGCGVHVVAPVFQTPTMNTSITRLVIKGVKCDVEEILALASSLPSLKQLEVSVRVHETDHTPVIGFRQLGDGCPSLKRLSLELDLDGMDGILGYLDEDFAKYLPRKLRYLNITSRYMSYPGKDFERAVFLHLPGSLKEFKLCIDHIEAPDHEIALDLVPHTLRRFEYKELCYK